MTAMIGFKNEWKFLRSPEVNYNFNMRTGFMATWGATKDEDAKVSPYGPFIMDLEVSTECHGVGDVGPCKHCYKSNTPRGENMSFETFKGIFDKLPRTLTQIAFGIGDIWANEDLLKMFKYCRENMHNPGVVPNITINGAGLTDEWVDNISTYCGGVAISLYEPKDICYDAVKKLTDVGMNQVNIHVVVSHESFDRCKMLIEDAASDPRLAKMKAIMFLTLKPKGKRNHWNIIKDVKKYRELIDLAMSKGVQFGFDSCTAPIFLAAMKDHTRFEEFSSLSESCESTRFSGYANVKGEWWHCSFTEDEEGWKGVSIPDAENFERDVWNHPEVKRFREKLTCQNNEHIDKECYLCPVYSLYDEELIGNASDVSVGSSPAAQKVFKIRAA